MAAPVQFQFNADFPSQAPTNPPEFPPADPSPCARITTRVYNAAQGKVATVQNVLVRTRLPQPRLDSATSAMEDSSSSSSDGDSAASSDRMEEDVDMKTGQTNTVEHAAEERAYWMQRTIREAIYGRVLFAVVLKKRQRTSTANQTDWEVTDEHCAIKEMSWQHIRRERDRLAEDPIKEVSAMQFLKKWYDRAKGRGDIASTHTSSFAAVMTTNVMMPLDLLSDDRHLYSIMPYCDGGELFDRLDVNEKFSEGESRYWLHQILNGLENLQHAGICHRDMSLENLLVHESGALIIDMGMCLRIPYSSGVRGASSSSSSITQSFGDMNLEALPINGGDSDGSSDVDDPFAISRKTLPRHLISPQGTCGKWIYMSPEIYKNVDPFDGFAVDMWATGVILFLMLTGFPPWERACATDDRFRYMTAGYLVQMLTEWEIGISSDAMDLLQRMLFNDPKDRLSLEQVRAHPWMMNGPCTPPS